MINSEHTPTNNEIPQEKSNTLLRKLGNFTAGVAGGAMGIGLLHLARVELPLPVDVAIVTGAATVNLMK